MSDDMFGGFDPLDILMKQQHKTNQLEQNIKQLAIAFNDRSELLEQMVNTLKMVNDRLVNIEMELERINSDIGRLYLSRDPR